MDFTLRQMTGHDLPAVAEIEAGVFTDWYRIYRHEPDPLGERTQEQMRVLDVAGPPGEPRGRRRGRRAGGVPVRQDVGERRLVRDVRRTRRSSTVWE